MISGLFFSEYINRVRYIKKNNIVQSYILHNTLLRIVLCMQTMFHRTFGGTVSILDSNQSSWLTSRRSISYTNISLFEVSILIKKV